MANFTTRVELHDAVRGDYNTLHERMARQGFSRTIVGDSTRYQLPTAEYNLSGQLTKQQVLNKAKAAAGSVKSSYEVLVTKSNGRTWYGLPEV